MDTTEFVGKMNDFKKSLQLLKNANKEIMNSAKGIGGADSMTKQINNIKQQMKLYNDEIDKHRNKLAQAQYNIKRYASEHKVLEDSYGGLTKKTSAQRQELQKLVTSRNTATQEEQKAVLEISKLQAGYSSLASELSKLEMKYRMSNDGVMNFSKRLGEGSAKLQSVGDAMYRRGRDIAQTTAIMGAGAIGVIKVMSDYESAFAGVRKTVNATEPEFRKLSDGFRGLSKEIPVSAKELARVGESAGQLGIKVPNILKFTDTIAKLGMATNLASEEGASSLAKFANITQMSQDNFDRLGSSIVALGNNYATTEADIVSMATRLAGAGHAIGLTEPQIMGVATALSSVGIEAESGGSTFSKLMVNMKVATETGFGKAIDLVNKTGMSMRDLELMASNNSKQFKGMAQSLGMTTGELEKIIGANKNLERFAQVAGMSAESFREMFGKDSIGAIGKFVDGLSKAEERGSSAIEILDELGISEVRLRDTLLRLGGAQNLMNEAVKTGTDAWAKNSALNKEVAERNKTLASQFEIFKNKLVDVAIEAGEKLLPAFTKLLENSDGMIDMVRNLVMAFVDLPESIRNFLPVLALVGPGLMGIGKSLDYIGLMGKGVSKVLSAFRGAKIAKEFTEIATGGAELATSMGAVTKSGGLLKTLVGGLSFNPWVVGLGAVTVGAIALASHLGEVQEKARHVDGIGADLGEAMNKSLYEIENKAIEISTVMSTALTLDEDKKSKITSSYTSMFDGMRNVVDEQIKGMTDTYNKLPDFAKKYAENNVKMYTEKYSEAKSKIDGIEAEITAIVEKASEERRALRQDEVNKIKALQEEAKQAMVSTLGATAEERNRIMKNMSDSLESMDKQQLSSRMKHLKSMKDELVKAHADERKNLEDALNQGTLSYENYNKSVLESERRFGEQRKQLAIQLVETLKKQYEKAYNVDDVMNSPLKGKFLRDAEQMLKDFDMTYQDVANAVQENSQRIARDNEYLAQRTGTALESMNENVKKANEHWNSLITDEQTGRVVENLHKVVEEAIQTQSGWEQLRFDIKHADLTSNARQTIEEVLVQSGRWDELTIEEKAFLTATNAGITMQNFLEAKGSWDSFTPEQKALILNSNMDEKKAKMLETFGLWDNAEFRKLFAEIDTNAPDAQQKFTDLYRTWYSTHFQDKVPRVYVDGSQVPGTINWLQSYIQSLMGKTVYINTIHRTYHEQYYTAHTNTGRIQHGHVYTKATGDNNFVGGPVILGDGGRPEPYLTPDGEFGVSPHYDTLYNLPKGTKIWSSINKFVNSVKYNDSLNGLIKQLPHFATGTTRSFLDNMNFNLDADFLKTSQTREIVRDNSVNVTPNISINFGKVEVREEQDIFKLADTLSEILADRMQREMRLKGVGTVGN